MNLILEGERLRLRPIAADDLAFVTRLLTDPRVMEFAGGPYSEAQVVAELPLAVRRGAGGCIGIWCVTLRDTGEPIGTSLLLPLPIETDETDWDLVGGPDLPDAEIEIGYFLLPSAWGRGYATEAARMLLQFAFEETPLREVVAVINAENAKSRNVLLKAGLAEDGMRRAYGRDTPGFRITCEQWRAAHRRSGET